MLSGKTTDGNKVTKKHGVQKQMLTEINMDGTSIFKIIKVLCISKPERSLE